MPDLERYITYGASPRASINLILTARALAYVRGREYVLPQDVLDMAPDVMRHRLVLSFEALSDDMSPDADPVHHPRPRRAAHRPAPGPCSCPRRRLSAWRRSPAPARAPPSPSIAPGPRPVSAPERVLQRLDWQVVRRLDGLLQGDYRSLFRGSGLDLASLREYQPGDDVRRDRLERHGAHDHAIRPRVPRGPRDHRLVPARPQPLGGLRDGRATGGSSGRMLVDFTATLARVLTRRGNRIGRDRPSRARSTGRSRSAGADSRCCASSDELMRGAACSTGRRPPTSPRCSRRPTARSGAGRWS